MINNYSCIYFSLLSFLVHLQKSGEHGYNSDDYANIGVERQQNSILCAIGGIKPGCIFDLFLTLERA